MPISAIITGTGIYNIAGEEIEEKILETKYGTAQVYLCKDKDIVFLNRHNLDHSIPPHKINYRANMAALNMLGVKNILAAFAVGSINLKIKPGEFVVIDDLLDFTSGREATIFNGDTEEVIHVDMSIPFCPVLRKMLLDKAGMFDLNLYAGGTYVCTNGPRLETPAEIRMFRSMGGDVVGMTCSPEVILAKELNIRYAAVGLSINWAAGIQGNEVTFVKNLDTEREKLCRLFLTTLECLSDEDVM